MFDTTKLMTFSGDTKAWPVYLTIGNSQECLTRAQWAHMHPAWLYLGHEAQMFLNMGHQFFYDCMKKLLQRLVEAGQME
jgi:hypothetical protein